MPKERPAMDLQIGESCYVPLTCHGSIEYAYSVHVKVTGKDTWEVNSVVLEDQACPVCGHPFPAGKPFFDMNERWVYYDEAEYLIEQAVEQGG